jgi:hypothetical protein
MNSNNGRGRRLGVLFLCGWGGLVLLTAAGCGVVANLGVTPPTGEGGEGGDGFEPVAGTNNAGGSTVNQGGNGAVHSGGAPATAGAGGSPPPVIQNGGEGGGAGSDSTGPLPYPLQPTAPISADCACADADSVCNALNQCVPRCEPGGVCAVWRIERGFTSTLVNGDDIYFVLAAAHDLFGNPVAGDEGKETLWKARYPDLAPIKLGALAGEPSQLVGRVGNTTYVRGGYQGSMSLQAMADDGTLTARELPANAISTRVTAAGAFAMSTDGSIAKLEIGADGSLGQGFVPAVPALPQGRIPGDLFVGDRLWRGPVMGEICSFDLAALDAPGVCTFNGTKLILGVNGSRAVVFGQTYAIEEVDVGTGAVRVLSDVFEPSSWSSANPGMALANGWVTRLLSDGKHFGGRPEGLDEPSTLERFPVASPAPATPVFSNEVATAMANSGADFPFVAGPMVTSDAVYFSQTWQEPKGPGTSRYIFRAPLPE